MADQALHLRSDADLEAVLRAFGEEVAWPEPPSDLAAAVRARIVSSPPTAQTTGSRRSWWPARRALVAAVLILLVLAALAGAAGLGLPGLRLILGPAPVSPPPSLAPSASPAAGAPGSTLGLGDQVPLENSMPRRASRSRGRRTRPSDRPTPPTSIGRSVARSRSSGGRATTSPTRSPLESA